MKLGFIGLGRMGNRMVLKLVANGHDVVVWNRTHQKAKELEKTAKGKGKVEVAKTLKDMAEILGNDKKIIWSMLPAGAATEELFFSDSGIGHFLKSGDILIDGGNSNFHDTQRRWEHFESLGIEFLGIGVSGGIIAFEKGYPMMAGGSKKAYDFIKPVLDSLAKPSGGHEFFGEGGAGHFVKMVHNGIEYGYMQAIGEGFGVMEKSPYKLDLLKVSKLYQKGTLVSGFMMERTIDSLTEDPKLENLDGFIDDSGEGKWTVEAAKEENVPINVILESLEFRKRSREDEKISSSFAARMVAALRKAFGGHAIKEK